MRGHKNGVMLRLHVLVAFMWSQLCPFIANYAICGLLGAVHVGQSWGGLACKYGANMGHGCQACPYVHMSAILYIAAVICNITYIVGHAHVIFCARLGV